MTDITLTIEEADAIHTSRGNADWVSLDDTVKSAAIVNAIDYITFNYGPFKADASPDDHRFKIATALLAREIQKTPVALSSEQAIKSKTVKSGTKELETVYQDSDKSPVSDPYPLVLAILSSLRVTSASTSGVSFGRMVP